MATESAEYMEGNQDEVVKIKEDRTAKGTKIKSGGATS